MCNNIVLTIRGEVEPAEVVIIGAHMDSRNTGYLLSIHIGSLSLFLGRISLSCFLANGPTEPSSRSLLFTHSHFLVPRQWSWWYMSRPTLSLSFVPSYTARRRFFFFSTSHLLLLLVLSSGPTATETMIPYTSRLVISSLPQLTFVSLGSGSTAHLHHTHLDSWSFIWHISLSCIKA